jgi:hypothetical protein
VLAVAAIGAVSASAAQAGDLTVGTPGSGSAIITAETDVINEFKVKTGLWRCTTIKFSPTTVTNGATTVTVHPEYSGCKTFGVTATTSTTGCNYLFHTTAAAGGTATWDIVCEAGKEITVTPTGINCILHFPSQNGLTGITFDKAVNATTGKDDLTMTINVSGIHYTETGAGCISPGTHTDGTYTGSVTINGFEDIAGIEGNPVHIWVD